MSPSGLIENSLRPGIGVAGTQGAAAAEAEYASPYTKPYANPF